MRFLGGGSSGIGGASNEKLQMVLYRPIEELFGIEEDNATYFLHGESTKDLAAFFEAFGRCLEHIFNETR